MKSGLEDRNNVTNTPEACGINAGLNEVRPGRPEQLGIGSDIWLCPISVSMKSGLEDRNNAVIAVMSSESYPVSMKSGLEDRNNNANRKLTKRRNEASQ